MKTYCCWGLLRDIRAAGGDIGTDELSARYRKPRFRITAGLQYLQRKGYIMKTKRGTKITPARWRAKP